MNMALQEGLKKLRLNYLADNFNEFITGSQKAKITGEKLIERIVELELVEKARRGTERRVRQARLGKYKHISHFDWAWPEGLDKKTIDNLMAGTFVDQCRNLILAGAQGLGKTMIATNIGHEALMRGKNVIFTSASDMVMALKSQDNHVDLNRMLKKYVASDLLILDELGYLSYDCQAADLIFEVVNRRYENGSIIITTNLAFKDWNTVFPGAACLTAMIDRLTHHCEVLQIKGPSFRLKESKQR